jgi:hypothetical protein
VRISIIARRSEALTIVYRNLGAEGGERLASAQPADHAADHHSRPRARGRDVHRLLPIGVDARRVVALVFSRELSLR